MVVIGVIVVLMAMLVPALSRARAAAQSVSCLANLRQISLAFQYYANGNGTVLPDPASSNQSWEQMLACYVTPTTFVCGSDMEVGPVLGSSYDWRDTGDPATTAAGRRINDIRRPDVILVYDTLPGWHSKGRMNVGFLDGSSRTMEQRSVIRDLNNSVGSNWNPN